MEVAEKSQILGSSVSPGTGPASNMSRAKGGCPSLAAARREESQRQFEMRDSRDIKFSGSTGTSRAWHVDTTR